MSDEKKEHIIVVREVADAWQPQGRFASIKDAQHWLKTTADTGIYHILAFRYEDCLVNPPEPQPVRNEVDFGKQHLVRRTVTDDGEIVQE